jgi:hypothetical protein
MNFEIPISNKSLSQIDSIGLKRLIQKPVLSHCTSLTITSNGILPTTFETIQLVNLNVSLSWLLSDSFRNTFISPNGSFVLLRGEFVSVRGSSMCLSLDESIFDSLGLSHSKSIDLNVGVESNVLKAADSIVELDRISCQAAFFLNGIQMNMFEIISEMQHKPEIEFESISIQIDSKRFGSRAAAVPTELVDLVEFCSSIRLDHSRGDQFNQVSINNYLIHPMYILSIIEQFSTMSDHQWICITLGCEANAEINSFDAISFILKQEKINVVACGRPSD